MMACTTRIEKRGKNKSRSEGHTEYNFKSLYFNLINKDE